MTTRNLIVVAHPDDEILGFGGTGYKLTSQDEVVRPLILCGMADARTKRPSDDELHRDMLKANRLVGFLDPMLGTFPNIRLNTVPHIELVQFIEEQIADFSPTRVFTHHPADLNDDHRQVSQACQAAVRVWQRRPTLVPVQSLHFMEVLSATDWGFDHHGMGFRPNLYVEIGDQLARKLDALECYRSVMRPYPHPRSTEAIEGLAAYRGGQAGQVYAEAFQTVFRRELE